MSTKPPMWYAWPYVFGVWHFIICGGSFGIAFSMAITHATAWQVLIPAFVSGFEFAHCLWRQLGKPLTDRAIRDAYVADQLRQRR